MKFLRLDSSIFCSLVGSFSDAKIVLVDFANNTLRKQLITKESTYEIVVHEFFILDAVSNASVLFDDAVNVLLVSSNPLVCLVLVLELAIGLFLNT